MLEDLARCIPLKSLFPAPMTKSAAAALAEDISIDDDRNNIQQNDPVLLIVEDDPTFARILIDMAHEHGLKALVALRGNTALALATEFRPSAITLDIGLPDMMGWTIVDRLKHDSRTRQIPGAHHYGRRRPPTRLGLGRHDLRAKGDAEGDLAQTFGLIRLSAEPRVRKLIVVSGDARSETAWSGRCRARHTDHRIPQRAERFSKFLETITSTPQCSISRFAIFPPPVLFRRSETASLPTRLPSLCWAPRVWIPPLSGFARFAAETSCVT